MLHTLMHIGQMAKYLTEYWYYFKNYMISHVTYLKRLYCWRDTYNRPFGPQIARDSDLLIDWHNGARYA